METQDRIVAYGFKMAVALAPMSMALNGMAASSYPFVPTEFNIPSLEIKNYRLEC